MFFLVTLFVHLSQINYSITHQSNLNTYQDQILQMTDLKKTKTLVFQKLPIFIGFALQDVLSLKIQENLSSRIHILSFECPVQKETKFCGKSQFCQMSYKFLMSFGLSKQGYSIFWTLKLQMLKTIKSWITRNLTLLQKMKIRKLENQQIYKSGGFTVKRQKMQQILIPFLT